MLETPLPPRGKRPAVQARAEHTRLEILEVAERLFAENGYEAVSLRQIAAEAGKSNNNIVQYHFETKDNLLKALMSWRVHQMESARQAMLEQAEAQGMTGDIRTLLGILCLPLLDIYNKDGHRRFPKVLGEYLFRIWPRLKIHPADEDPASVPALSRTINLMHQRLRYIPKDIIRMRSSSCLGMFINNISRIDSQEMLEALPVSKAIQISETFEMMVAAMNAPLGVELAKSLEK